MLRANILTNFAGFSPRKSLLREIYMLKTKSNEITDTHQAPCEAPETAEALRRSMWQAWLRSLLLFCCASVYVELCLHLCVYRSLDRRAVYLVLFGLLGGTVCALLTTHLPKIARQIVGVLLVAVQVLFAEVQLMYHAIFGNFMPISQVSMGGNVITNFDSQILYSIGKNIVPILRSEERRGADRTAQVEAGAGDAGHPADAVAGYDGHYVRRAEQVVLRLQDLHQREHLYRQQL